MKTAKELNKQKVTVVRIDPTLEQLRDKVLFPEKLVKANEMLKTARLPIRGTAANKKSVK